jgi:hypothetical protein
MKKQHAVLNQSGAAMQGMRRDKLDEWCEEVINTITKNNAQIPPISIKIINFK